jgi:hypothetical protein
MDTEGVQWERFTPNCLAPRQCRKTLHVGLTCGPCSLSPSERAPFETSHAPRSPACNGTPTQRWQATRAVRAGAPGFAFRNLGLWRESPGSSTARTRTQRVRPPVHVLMTIHATSTPQSSRPKWRPAFSCVPFLGTRRHAAGCPTRRSYVWVRSLRPFERAPFETSTTQ